MSAADLSGLGRRRFGLFTHGESDFLLGHETGPHFGVDVGPYRIAGCDKRRWKKSSL
jgi:hypothetical protein